MNLGRDSRIIERLPAVRDVLLPYSARRKSVAVIPGGEDGRFLASNCSEISGVGRIDTAVSPDEPAATAP